MTDNNDFETCPIVSYLEESKRDDIDIDVVREFRDAAQTGDIERVYGYGLLIHDLLIGGLGGPLMSEVPDDVAEQAFAKAYKAFSRTAEQGYAHGMLMTAWCLAMGFGTEENMTEARIWFGAAEKALPADDPQIQVMRGELKSRGLDAAITKHDLN